MTVDYHTISQSILYSGGVEFKTTKTHGAQEIHNIVVIHGRRTREQSFADTEQSQDISRNSGRTSQECQL